MSWLQRVRAGLAILHVADARRAAAYALARAAAEMRFRGARRGSRGAPLRPGPLADVEPTPRGARLRFAAAELEVAFLADDLVRLTWQPGALPAPYAVVERSWPEVAVELDRGDGVRLSAPLLAVRVSRDGELELLDGERRTLRREAPPERRGPSWTQRARLRAEECLYGLGERASGLDLRGGRYRLWNRDPGGSYGRGDDPLYLSIPVLVGVHGEGSWLAFSENSHDGHVRLGGGATGAPGAAEAVVRFAGGALRTYYVAGTPDRLLARYTELTGRAPLPPRWALGYHQSRWSYPDEATVRAVAAGFQAHGLPLAAIHLDIDYMDRYRVFTVDAKKFPDLGRLGRELAAHGTRLVVILDPGIASDDDFPMYRDGRARRAFCRLPDGTPARAPVWPGWCEFPDFSSEAVRVWWGTHYRALLDAGVAGFWHDMNEPGAFAAWGDPTLPSATRHDVDGRGGDHVEVHNLYGLLMARAGREALEREAPGRRPFLLTRSGWAGIQRYAWTWTGDVETSWAALHQTVATVVGLGLSGVPYSGPDVGGFSGDPDAELYLRWLQLAVFLPFLRTHSARHTKRREPWSFGERALAIARDLLALRSRLIPYLYSLAWEAHATGAPLVRPLFWPRADEPELCSVDDAFLLGDHLLVAPITGAGIERRSVPLPRGRWYELVGDATVEGPGRAELDAPLERIPTLVRGGGVLPTAERDGTALHVYTPGDDERRTSRWYDDAGDGAGPSRCDELAVERRDGTLVLTRRCRGDYPFPAAGVTLHLHGASPRAARRDGEVLAADGPTFRVGEFAEIVWEPG